MKRRTLRIVGLVLTGGVVFQVVGCASFVGTTLLQTVVNAVVGSAISSLIANAAATTTG